MPVTTTYSWEALRNLSTPYTQTESDVVRIANSEGFASIGTDSGDHMDGNSYTASGDTGPEFTFVPGTNGAISQLANGNLVIVSQDADSILFTIRDSTTGAEVVASTDLADTNSTNADVAGLTGGRFVIVSQDAFTQPDNDIDVTIRGADGSAVSSFTIDASTADDQNASVAALDNGNFAVTWQRNASGSSQLWYAVYDADGNIVKAAALLDNAGSVNAKPSITATNGGFAIAYEDNGWDLSDVDVTLATFDSAGTFLDWFDVADDTVTDSNASVTRMSNGMVAVAFTKADGSNDVIINLIDPTTGAGGTTLATRAGTAGQSISDETDFSSIAGVGGGKLAAFWTNSTDNALQGEFLQAVRTSEGDGADNSIVGDDLSDVMNGNAGNDTLTGNGGNDVLSGGDGNDNLLGGDGDDVLNGGAGADNAQGGDGNDYMYAGTNKPELIDGGTGVDTLDTTGYSSNYTVNLGTGLTNYAGQSFINLENLIAGAGNDTLTGTTGANIIQGGDGNDKLFGDAGSDTLYGEDDNDKLDGGAGGDTMYGASGNDTYTVDDGGDLASEETSAGFDDGGTADTVLASVSYGLGNYIERLTLTGSAAINGFGNDLGNQITGNSGANSLYGYGGNDILTANGGGVDFMDGGEGSDTYYADGSDTVVDTGAVGTDTIVSTGGYTLVPGSGVENLQLKAGSSNAATLIGDAGANRITGNDGANQLRGMDGDDILKGGLGDDKLTGGLGRDSLTGGAGVDTFVFANGDTPSILSPQSFDALNDWEAGIDKIDLSIIGAGGLVASAYAEVTMAGNGLNAAVIAATAAMADGLHTVVFVAGATDGWLLWNTDADKHTPEQAVRMIGQNSLAAFDRTDVI